MSPVPTPGQTVGPFFGFALPYERSSELVAADHANAVRLQGRVLDGAGSPVPDALLELWQPDPTGSVGRDPGSLARDGSVFTGFGRAETDPDGRYHFTTLMPGAVTGGAARYFMLTVFARGLLDRLFTRIYLPAPDEELAADPLLASVEPDRRSTLMARSEEGGYVFDVRLQGEDETVFVAYRRD